MIKQQRGGQPVSGITILLLVMWALLIIRLDSAWLGHQDQNGVWISSAVANYERYGASDLGYLQVVNAGPATPETFEYYVHHPPLIVWGAAAFNAVFGRYDDGRPSEAIVRLVSVYATMISLASLYVIARRLFRDERFRRAVRLPLWTTAMYGFTPMIIYYGRMPNHEPLALAFLLMFTAIFINWMRQPTFPRWLAMLLLAGLAMWSAWAAAFIFAGLGVVALVYGTGYQRRWMILLGVLTIVITLAIPLFYRLQYDGTIDALREAFSFRTSNQEFSRGSENFTLFQFVTKIIGDMFRLMGLLVLAMGFTGLVLLARRRQTLTSGVIFALVLGTVGYMLVFRNAFFIHDYYKIYFMPGFTLAAAVAIVAAGKAPRRGWLRYARPLVVSFAVVTAGMTVFFAALLHNSAVNTFTLDLVDVLEVHTEEADYIATNLEKQNSAVDYYAFRNVVWEHGPDAFLNEVADLGLTFDAGVVYLFCSSASDAPLPIALMDYPRVEVLDTCELITMQ